MPDTTERAGAARGLFPALLRHWRTRRGLSQLDLALASGVSARHVSFLETGRSGPSVEMVLRLASALDVPLRSRNTMLRASGHPPHYPDPDREIPAAVIPVLEVMKAAHEPFPMIVIDRSYGVLDVNRGAAAVLTAAIPGLAGVDLRGSNLARLTLDPRVGGQVIANHVEVSRDLLWRMHHELLLDPDDTALRELLTELLDGPDVDPDWRRPDPTTPSAPTLELRLRVADEIWSFVLVVSVLQAPLDVRLEQLRVEQWFPRDELTAAGCSRLASEHDGSGSG